MKQYTVVNIYNSTVDGGFSLSRLVGGKRYLVKTVPGVVENEDLGVVTMACAALDETDIAAKYEPLRESVAPQSFGEFWKLHLSLLVECEAPDFVVVAMERDSSPGMAYSIEEPGAVVDLKSPTPEQLGAAIRAAAKAAR